MFLLVKRLSFQPLFEERIVERNLLSVHVDEVFLEQSLRLSLNNLIPAR